MLDTPPNLARFRNTDDFSKVAEGAPRCRAAADPLTLSKSPDLKLANARDSVFMRREVATPCLNRSQFLQCSASHTILGLTPELQ